MRSHKKLTKRQILRVLREADHCRLGLCVCDIPYIIPMHYCFRIKDQQLFFRLKSKPQGKKIEIMEHNTNVCLEFEAPTCNGMNTVIVQGSIINKCEGNCPCDDVMIEIVACSITGRHKKRCNCKRSSCK